MQYMVLGILGVNISSMGNGMIYLPGSLHTNTIPVLGGFLDVQFRSLGFIQSLINIVLVTALGFSIKVLK